MTSLIVAGFWDLTGCQGLNAHKALEALYLDVQMILSVIIFALTMNMLVKMAEPECRGP